MSENEERQKHVSTMSWDGLEAEYARRARRPYDRSTHRNKSDAEKRGRLEDAVRRLRQRDAHDANRSPRLTLEQAQAADARDVPEHRYTGDGKYLPEERARRENTRGLRGTAADAVVRKSKEESIKRMAALIAAAQRDGFHASAPPELRPKLGERRPCSPGCAYGLESIREAEAAEEAELQLCAHVLGLMWQANYDDGQQAALADAIAVTGRP